LLTPLVRAWLILARGMLETIDCVGSMGMMTMAVGDTRGVLGLGVLITKVPKDMGRKVYDFVGA
jgi:hypothetical protein